MMRATGLLAVVALLEAGCNRGGASPADLASDLATSIDSAIQPDLAMPDLAMPDLVAPAPGCKTASFAAAVSYVADFGRRSVAIGDLDGDGKPDLVAAGTTQVNVFLGNGKGAFAAPVSYIAAGPMTSVAIGDLNGDGRPDVAAANWQANGVSVFLGTGKGVLSAAVTYAAGAGPESVAIGDLDGDGKLDRPWAARTATA